MTKQTTDLTKFDPIVAGLAALDDKYTHLIELNEAELDAKCALVDGLAEVKAAKKELTTVRTSIGKAHKEAKAPILEASRALDGKKKELEGEIKKREQPLKDALDRLKSKTEAEAKQAQDRRIKELEAQLAEANGALAANGIAEATFVEKQIDITITNKAQLTALGKIIGEDNVKALKFDEDGNGYTLGVLVRRKEMAQ